MTRDGGERNRSYRPEIGTGIEFSDPDYEPGHRQTDDPANEQGQAGIIGARHRSEADQEIRDQRDADQRQNLGRDHAFIERAHDRLRRAEFDEEGADD